MKDNSIWLLKTKPENTTVSLYGQNYLSNDKKKFLNKSQYL